jgi:hypothetical protein
MSDLKLGYGLRNIPADVTTAWGARWIWPNDMVHNRQDLQGPDKDKLIAWLNGGAIAAARVAAPSLIQIGLSPREDREVVLYEDERGVIKANPQGSHGYLYVAAWLKGEA